MRVAFFAYRNWAKQIRKNLEDVGYEFTTLKQADVVLYYGWSKIIPAKIYTKKLCLILHPSPLPKYRGGSPLQHQIINGETKSAVTILKVEKELDSGDIYSQTSFSLRGNLQNILNRITEIGTRDTMKILYELELGKLKPKKQKGKVSIFKRRQPYESVIGKIDLWTAKQFYNFIRALQKPYPEPYFICKDGKKLYITGAHL